MALTEAVGTLVNSVDCSLDVMPLMVRILGGPEWLSQAYLEANVTPHLVNFGWFLRGFNNTESLVEFIAVEDGPSIPTYRARGEPLQS